MKRFLAGLLIGVASMYWYAYEKDGVIDSVKGWLAQASHDPDAPQKVDKMFSKRR
jgi:hypothetical protein